MKNYSPIPFPKPIQAAIELLRDRTVMRWLQWQPYTPGSPQMALVLATQDERRVRTKRLWGTWEKYAAAAMQESLRQIGISVENSDAFDLPPRSAAMLLWSLPAMPKHQAAPRPLIAVFSEA